MRIEHIIRIEGGRGSVTVADPGEPMSAEVGADSEASLKTPEDEAKAASGKARTARAARPPVPIIAGGGSKGVMVVIVPVVIVTGGGESGLGEGGGGEFGGTGTEGTP
jgi:hypothetical protein